MSERQKPPPGVAADEASERPLSPTRRRWLQAGLTASPVLMTVVSRPVLAAQCVPPSAYVSLGASGVTYTICTGRGPTSWSTPPLRWPDPYKPTGGPNATTWCQAVNCVLNDPFKNSTLLAVLQQSGNQVARYVGAAVLNSAAGSVPANILDLATIKDIWVQFATNGSFAPTSGASWNAAEIVDYLSKTMDSP